MHSRPLHGPFRKPFSKQMIRAVSSFSLGSYFLYTSFSLLSQYLIPSLFFSTEREARNIDDLTDLLAEDWAKLGATREMGEKSQKFFRTEMENT